MEFNMQIENVQNFIKERMGPEFEMHDYLHAFRVLSYAREILTFEKADRLVVETAALVHDFVDGKLFENIQVQNNLLINFLRDNKYSDADIQHIADIINNMSYSARKTPNSFEGKIVQDADRLDALLALGVLRPFTFGAKRSRPIYDSPNSSLCHYIEKRLRIEGMLNTKGAKQIAAQRAEISYVYLAYLLNELPDDIYEKKHFKEELDAFYKKYSGIIPAKLLPKSKK